MQTQNSQQLYQRALQVSVAGVHSNSRARTPHPLYFTRADGPYLWDVDNNRYIDLGMGNGAILLGHKNPAVQAAINDVLETGLTTGVESEYAIRAAELLVEMVPAAERVRFTNTGTEALLHALQIARVQTGRQRLAKVEGAYHGWVSSVFVSTWPDLTRAGSDDTPIALPGANGLDPQIVKDTLVLPFNDIKSTERLLRQNAAQLAAIIVEPTMIDIGFVAADHDYLAMLRRVADETGVLLIFDELLTGFRLAKGGAQEFYGINADISLFGKALGNGFPVAAVAGKKAILERSAPGPNNANFVGTFNGNVVMMAAVEASLRQLLDGKVINEVQNSTNYLIKTFTEMANHYQIPAQMKGAGGHIHWYFNSQPVNNYRQAASSSGKRYTAFINELLKSNILVTPKYLLHHAISLAHDSAVLDELVAAMDRGLAVAAQTAAY